MAIKCLLGLARTRRTPTPSLACSLSRFPPNPICNIDYTVSHWFPDITPDMPSSPVLSLTFNEKIPFPPLPPINDDDIRTQVFTHRSYYARPGHVFEDHPDDPSPDNEK